MGRQRAPETTAVGRILVPIDGCEVITGWEEGATGTDNLAITTSNVEGRHALTFDKVAGGDTASIYKTVDGSIALGERSSEMEFALRVYLSALTDVAAVHLDVGSNDENYVRYSFPDTVLTAASWMDLSKGVAEWTPSDQVGTGINTNQIKWYQVSVEFDDAADTLSGIIVDEIVAREKNVTVEVTGSLTVPGVAQEATLDSIDGKTADQTSHVIDACDVATGWQAVAGSSATNIAASRPCIEGANSVFAEKVGGGYGTVAIEKSFGTPIDVPGDSGEYAISFDLWLQSKANVLDIWIRAGEDATNNNRYFVPIAPLKSVRWNRVMIPLHQLYDSGGSGWDLASGLDYFQVSVTVSTGGKQIRIDDIRFRKITAGNAMAAIGRPPTTRELGSGLEEIGSLVIPVDDELDIEDYFEVTGTTATEIIATPGTGYQILLTQLYANANNATQMYLDDGSTQKTANHPMATNQMIPYPPRKFGENKAVRMKGAQAGVTIYGTFKYRVIPA